MDNGIFYKIPEDLHIYQKKILSLLNNKTWEKELPTKGDEEEERKTNKKNNKKTNQK